MLANFRKQGKGGSKKTKKDELARIGQEESDIRKDLEKMREEFQYYETPESDENSYEDEEHSASDNSYDAELSESPGK